MAFSTGKHGVPEYINILRLMTKRNQGTLMIYDAMITLSRPFIAQDLKDMGFTEAKTYRCIKELDNMGLIKRLFLLPRKKGKGNQANGTRAQLWGLA